MPTRPSSRARGWSPTCTGGSRPGEVESGSTARIWVSGERARWVREDHPGATELSDGSLIFERTYASYEWLAREMLKEAGDAVVLEPEEARRAVLEAAEQLAVTA